MKHSSDAVKNTIRYLNEISEDDEATTKELQTFFEENNFISDSLFYLKLDRYGNKLNRILKKSGKFKGERKYSKKYRSKLMHWKKVEE